MKSSIPSEDIDTSLKNINGALDSNSSAKDGLADEDSNLMVKLKFLTYKVLHYHYSLSSSYIYVFIGHCLNFQW